MVPKKKHIYMYITKAGMTIYMSALTLDSKKKEKRQGQPVNVFSVTCIVHMYIT